MVLVAAALTAKAPLHMRGVFVEACSCIGTCRYEVSGVNPGCNAIGGYSVSSGSFDDKDISGIKMAFVVAPKGLLYLYAECAPSQSDITKRLMFTLFNDYGKSQGLHPAKIRIQRDGGPVGHFTLSIDSSDAASVQIEPVTGGDGKMPVVLHNVFGDPYDELWQAKVVNGSFNKSGHSFSLKGTNAYYIADVNIDKRV